MLAISQNKKHIDIIKDIFKTNFLFYLVYKSKIHIFAAKIVAIVFYFKLTNTRNIKRIKQFSL